MNSDEDLLGPEDDADNSDLLKRANTNLNVQKSAFCIELFNDRIGPGWLPRSNSGTGRVDPIVPSHGPTATRRHFAENRHERLGGE